MKISILCSDPEHPVYPFLERWCQQMISTGNQAELAQRSLELTSGDLLFLVSCSELITSEIRANYSASLVLHASDLPQGRGWSPYIWSILEGQTTITVSLLEAQDPVDSGDIWLKTQFHLTGHELLEEIHEKLFEAEIKLMSQAVEQWQQINPTAQPDTDVSYYPKRSPEDSRLDVNKTIAEQFDLLRVVDNQRFPAFFEHRGQRYRLKIEKAKDE